MTSYDADEPLVRARGWHKRFRDRIALDGFDLDVPRASLLGLLGPNGTGKTTAFRALTGLCRLDAGSLTWRGSATTPDDRRFRRRIGVVFQDPSVDVRLTARENLHLGAHLYGLSRAQTRDRVAWALSFMHLADRADELVQRYSGGMRRRLEIARALLHDPELLILDEPGEGIDPDALARIWDELTRLREQRGLTVLATTHRPDEADRCDRLAIMDGGKVVATGTPDDLRGRVAGDVLVVTGRDRDDILAAIRTRLGLAGRAEGSDGIVVETGPGGAGQAAPGAALVPRVAELFAPGRIASISVRRPTLADVFAKLTGHGLAAEHADATKGAA